MFSDNELWTQPETGIYASLNSKEWNPHVENFNFLFSLSTAKTLQPVHGTKFIANVLVLPHSNQILLILGPNKEEKNYFSEFPNFLSNPKIKNKNKKQLERKDQPLRNTEPEWKA